MFIAEPLRDWTEAEAIQTWNEKAKADEGHRLSMLRGTLGSRTTTGPVLIDECNLHREGAQAYSLWRLTRRWKSLSDRLVTLTMRPRRAAYRTFEHIYAL